jgi:hypothetical protein
VERNGRVVVRDIQDDVPNAVLRADDSAFEQFPADLAGTGGYGLSGSNLRSRI